MRQLLFAILGTIAACVSAQAQITIKPEKGGLQLKIWNTSFTTSDSSDNDIYFQFEDGTDIKYIIKKSKPTTFKRVMRKIDEFGTFHIKTGHHSSLRTNHSGWRLYKYRYVSTK